MSLILLPIDSYKAATNMAMDAVLLDSLPQGNAVFRHYGWTEPSITFGYMQRIDEVRAVVPEKICLCRRLTGGGIVDHRSDWTYALVLHASLKVAKTPATELYRALHRCIQQALETQSIETQLAPCPRACGQKQPKSSTGPNICFIQPTANDILATNGKKIAGAAMKRTRQGLLIQGSIDRNSLPKTFNFKDFFNKLPEVLADKLNMKLSKSYASITDQADIQRENKRFESGAWQNRY